MKTISIKIEDSEGFTTTFVTEGENFVTMRDRVVEFIDHSLNVSNVFLVKLSNLNVKFNVTHDYGNSGYKIPAIKAVRTVTRYGLVEGKAIVDALEHNIRTEMVLPMLFTKEEAIRAKEILAPHFSVELVNESAPYLR